MKQRLKQAAIIGGLEAISRLRLQRLLPSAAGRGLIFTLHHVRPKIARSFDPNAHLEITPAFLEDVIVASLAAGLVPVSLEELPDRLADKDDRRRFVCFTLDDGYRNNALHAAPVFRRYGVPYTIFITPGFVEREAAMWWETAAALLRRVDRLALDFGAGEEVVACDSHDGKVRAFLRICQMINSGDQDAGTARLDATARRHGIDPLGLVDREVMNASDLRALASDPLVRFGGHTMTHPLLAHVPDERLTREIRLSLSAVANYAGRDMTSFAYPYGTACAAGPREFKAAADAGLKLAVTTRPGMLTDRTLERPMALNRVSLNGLYQKKHYVDALISGLPFKLTA